MGPQQIDVMRRGGVIGQIGDTERRLDKLDCMRRRRARPRLAAFHRDGGTKLREGRRLRARGTLKMNDDAREEPRQRDEFRL